MAEKVDYLKHASLVYPLNELGMSVFRVYDAGSLHIKERIQQRDWFREIWWKYNTYFFQSFKNSAHDNDNGAQHIE